MTSYCPLKRLVLVLVILTCVLGTAFGSLSCSRGRYSGSPESITFGALPTGSAGLIYIAQEQHFLADNGLSVNIKDYATGVATIDALLKGEVDIAWAAELPLVRRAFTREQISIFAVLSRFTDEFLFVRKERVGSIPDLKGKKIGVPRNTIAEFYLARFLELNGLNTKDVSILDVQPGQSVEAITGASVDGVVTWEPFASQIRVQMVDKTLAWSVQSSQPGYGLIICRNDWINGHTETLKRFLKSLTQAEDYMNRNQEAAKGIIQKRMSWDDALVKTFWSENQFSISLDQSLIFAMEDEARWMIANNLTTQKQVPNFLNYIYMDGLQAVKPEAVSIIR